MEDGTPCDDEDTHVGGAVSVLWWSSQLGLIEVPQVLAPVALWLNMEGVLEDSYSLVRYEVLPEVYLSGLVLTLHCPCEDGCLHLILFETRIYFSLP